MKNQLLLPTNLTCGYFDCSTFGSLKVSPKRISTMFELEYFLEDGKNTFSDNVAYPVRKNFVCICYPGEERYSELPFKTKYVKFALEGKLAEILMKAPRYFHVSQSVEANALLDEIITLYTTQAWDDVLLYGKLLSYISLLLVNANSEVSNDAYKNEITVKAQEFIKEHYREALKLSDIAKEVNLSPNYFHTIFTESCKTTPREYLEEYRVSVAKRYLLTTELSLLEISERCGFNNQQYMTTVFKKKVGCSPAQFKKQNQNAYFI